MSKSVGRESAAISGWLMAALPDDLLSDISEVYIDKDSRKIHVVYDNHSEERNELIRKEIAELKTFCHNMGMNHDKPTNIDPSRLLQFGMQ